MDAWQTYAFEFKGGLVSNLSPLQHGIQLPGSARTLKNFEPSTEGGYRRIEGFDKFSDSVVPFYGEPLVQGSGQSGTTLVVSNIFISPADGDTFTIAGVSGTYTIASSGVIYDSTSKTATLTLTTSLASSPADKAAVTFVTGSGIIKGIAFWEDEAVAYRNSDVYNGTGADWTKINIPSYGTVLVNGAGQSGTTLNVDGVTLGTPRIGDTFKIAGVEKVYTITAAVTVTSGAAALTITPSLASSPSDNAAITMLSCDRSNGIKHRHTKYRLNSTEKICFVDSTNYPAIWDQGTFKVIDGTTDVLGADFVTYHKNQLFFANDDKLIFTAPYTDDSFSAALGAGVIQLDGVITGIIPFRGVLVIFTERTIHQLTGSTLQDFVLQPITRNVGCISPDTIQEISGDVMFLGPEGLRLLSATDTNGDFNLGVVSKLIQAEMTELITSSTSFASVIIKQKSQYRLLGYNSSVTRDNARGIIGSQLMGEQNNQIAWAETVGIKAYVADSYYIDRTETVLFANNDGYVYQMESGSSFDGRDIIATFSTPFVPITDPRIRKTFYKLFLYTDPQGSFNTSVNLKYNFDNQGSIQPNTIEITNSTGSIGFYGTSVAKYGTTVYGARLKKLFETQVIGSGFTVSLQFVSEGTDPPFSLDAATLEYSTHDRR